MRPWLPVIFVVTLLAITAADRSRTSGAPLPVPPADSTAGRSRVEAGTTAVVAVADRRAPSPGSSATTTTRPLELAPDAAATLAEQLALRQLAHDTDLPLTEAQWLDFATVAAHYQAVRQAYEASIATVTRTATGAYHVAVPAYADAGDTLRDYFYAELGARLGGDAAEVITTQLGSSLESYFAGFGLSVQTLDFAGDPLGADRDYLVLRTATFWNSQEGGPRLNTRREAHHPAVEDPTGQQWSPFLALLAAHRAGASDRTSS